MVLLGEVGMAELMGSLADEVGSGDRLGTALSSSALLASLAHELRTPLSSLAISSELLADGAEELDRREIRGMASTIHSGTLWLQGLVENLLCAAMLDEGRLRLRPRSIALAEIAAEVRPLVEPLLARKSQRLRVRSRGWVPRALADGRRIGQVLVNLITNASKYDDSRGTIEVTLSEQAGRVRVTVADRGPGLPFGAEQSLFESFHRAELAVERGKDGVGLGLAVVRSIVQAHGGEVGAANRSGGGSEFWFEIPACPDSYRASPRPAKPVAMCSSIREDGVE